MTPHLRRRTLAAGAVLAAAGVRPARAVEAGQPAPDIELPGATVPVARLSDLRGKLVYLDFWASWCGPCRQSFPWMNRMHAAHAPRGLQVLAINLDARRSDADAFLAKTPATFALAFDPRAESAKRYAIKGMPSSVLIDAGGQVIGTHRGFRDEDRAELEARIVAALPR